MPKAKPLTAVRYTDRPCRRADPSSPIDHYESQPDAVREDGVSTAAWEQAAREFMHDFLAEEHRAGRFPRDPSVQSGE